MATLTPNGRAKLARLANAATNALAQSLPEALRLLKDVVVENTPTEEEEGVLISAGTPQGLTRRVGTQDGPDGVPDGGRFFRQAGMKSLREAISESPIAQLGPLRFGTCSAAQIDAVTGFFWNTKRAPGVEGPSLPFDQNYVRAMEFGGDWLVVPRTAALLNPSPGLVTERMRKTLQPIGMFRKARIEGRATVVTFVERAVREAVRAEGVK